MSKSNELIADYKSTDQDPTAAGATGSYEFDWNELYRRLGEPTDEEEPELEQRDFATMGRGLAKILDYILDVDLSKANAPHVIGRRLLALAWVIDPRRFQNASIRKLAKRLGASAPHLSNMAADSSRKFKISNRFQAHDWRKAA